jgi:hypothetical protein
VASDQNTDPVTEDALGGHHQIRLCDSNMDNDIAHAIRKYVRQHDQSCRLKDHFPDDDKQCRRLTRRKNTNLRHERHLHKIAQGRHVFCACEHHRDNRQVPYKTIGVKKLILHVKCGRKTISPRQCNQAAYANAGRPKIGSNESSSARLKVCLPLAGMLVLYHATLRQLYPSGVLGVAAGSALCMAVASP